MIVVLGNAIGGWNCMPIRGVYAIGNTDTILQDPYRKPKLTAFTCVLFLAYIQYVALQVVIGDLVLFSLSIVSQLPSFHL